MGYNSKNYNAQGGDKLVIGGTLEFTNDAVVTNMPDSGRQPYELPIAGASTLGGVKVGDGLSITEEGVLSADGITPAANQADSEATELSGLVSDFNTLLAALKTAGLMVSDANPGE